MNTYYLCSNMIYNCKHIFKKRWYHKVLGKPNLCLAEVEALSEDLAEKKFRLMGYHFGIFH